MPFPTWLAGMRITADRLDDRDIRVVEQGTDQTVTSSTTLRDTNLLIPGEVNAIYWYALYIAYRATITPDFRWAWVAPSGTSIDRFTAGRDEASPAGLTAGHPVALRYASIGIELRAGGGDADGTSPPANVIYAQDQGIIKIGGTAGSCVVRFAQFTSNANQTIFSSQSKLIYARIG